MQTTQTVLASLLLAVVVSAQTDPPPTAHAVIERLGAEWQQAQDSYREAIKALQAGDEWQAAMAAKDRTKLRELGDTVKKPDAAAFGARALAAADTFADDEQLLLLSWAATETGDPKTIEKVVAQVTASHLKSGKLDGLLENAMVLQRGVGADEAKGLLQRVIDESPHALPRAWAMYWLSMPVLRDKKASDADKAAAEQRMAEAGKLALGTPLGDRINAPRFEAEHLQIGMVAPEIVGEDVDGAAIKLSDYRGKVVVLDFWGFW